MTALTLLKDNEMELFDRPPCFNEEERVQFFVFPENSIKFRKLETKIGYILHEGYFMSRKKFFLPEHYREDIEYVKKLLGVKREREIRIQKHYSIAICNYHKQFILKKNGYNSFSDSMVLFAKEASELVKTSLTPREIFFSLLDYLDEKRIEVPGYNLFAKVITKSLNLFENDLVKIIDNTLTPEQKDMLDGFMNLPADDSLEVSAKNPYLITYLKNIEQSITPGKIKQSIADFSRIKELHDNLSGFFKSGIISNELINYYAIWVLKAEHIQFDAIRDIGSKRLYVTSFITYQYKIRQDYFVDTFLQAVQKYYNDAEKSVIEIFMQKDMNYKKQEQVTKIRNIIAGSKDKLNEIRDIVFSFPGLDSEKMKLIRAVLNNGDANRNDEILKELDKLENTGVKSLKDCIFHEELEKGCRKLLNRVSGILLILEFNPQSSDTNVYKAIEYYRQKKSKINNRKIPLEFMSKIDRNRLSGKDGYFNYNLYKVLLCKAVFDHIKSGSLNLLFSERYKSVDDYLINSKRWKENREELILRAGLERLNKGPQEIIRLLKDITDNQYKATNENITDNKYLKFSSKGLPKVTTPKRANFQDGIIHGIIGADRYIPLTKVLSDIRYCTDYISSFAHYNRKNSKSTPSDEAFYAATIALGCNIGIRRMGKISDEITADRLEYIVRWFYSKKTVDEANRKIISLTDSLPLSTIYLENQDKLNTSSDGQKFDVTIPSLHATHSPKYFRTGKGVSVYSFIDEKGRLYFNTVISPSERESNYLIDGLFHNDNIISDTHSTDTHGYSETIFGICYLLDVQFTPRIKRYHEQILYTFKDKTGKYYESQEYRILPAQSSYINEKIIVEQWDRILRLLCTIKLKESLPSNILKRLSSYSKQNPLYKAIKEVGRIYKTIFLLKYYDEVLLRQNIEKQLNRVELSHLFAKAVFFGNNQELKYATKEEQEIAVGCRHLIQNSIILWNYLFVSEKLSQITNPPEFQKQIDLLKNSSMLSWQHVNMHGKYDFNIEVDNNPFNLVAVKSLNAYQM
ncbi:MAG: Tn3 family transposase [Tannerella sp.]|jgi:TnpA family transposase|nr:Tn3 family transposase [Tannerella sp.]